MRYKGKQRGTTLMETLVAAAFFVIFSLAIYQLYAKVVELSARIRTKTIATQIASEQIEFIRNLQYSNVGIISGIPSGVIPATKNVSRGNVTFSVNTTIRNIDLPADGTLGGTPNDLSPADNKLMVVKVICTSCAQSVSVEYTSTVAPKSLETENGNGALVIKVIDANGIPVANANVSIINNSVSPAINFSDITDSAGVLTIVDAPPSAEKYFISVSKTGYSSDQTYLPGGSGNPNPVKPHITVVANTVSQTTFAIDTISSIALKVQSAQCASITGVSGSFVGSKLIGTPNVLKNTIAFSASGVSNTINNIEWDTYKINLSGSTYEIAGTNPVFPLSIPPNSSQDVFLTIKPAVSGSRLVVAVTELAGLPIADATVGISGPSGTFSGQTSIGSISQTDWNGGSGQVDFTDKSRFSSTDGGIDYTNAPGQIKLNSSGSTYVNSGELVSSTINLGAPATLQQLIWSPTSQPTGMGTNPIRFQIATNLDNTTWNFLGPDGTDATFYTTSTSNIASIHAGDQYLRYKVFLSTTDTSKTPSISDVAITYTSGCLPPGQIDFGGLSSGTYTITISKTGYTTTQKDITISSDTYETIQISP
ncbi:MAG: carboxypeptidase regulatory-like domain-containing protein [Candidatus Pacebacteria bacterium]|nr:carboxypeptidase regulatory-like domain-containing protein [Candidatus Paceibacterota bacterium]